MNAPGAQTPRMAVTAAAGEGPRVSIGQYSSAGRKARNDDSWGIVVPPAPLLASHGIAAAIADGMSPSEGAKEASECCVRSFLDDYYCTHASWSVKKSAGVVLNAINSWLYAQGQRQYHCERGMVCTFSGLVLKAGTAHIFHVGDCRIGRLRAGRLEPLTRDHRVQLGRGREHLARAMGVDQHLEIDYRAEPLEAGDVLLFTSDGIHDHVEARELVQLVADSAGDLDGAARALAERALAQGSADNLTCQIVRVDWPGRPDEPAHLQSLAALPFPPDLDPGMTFDGYAILRELHASKRTQVYLARDVMSDQLVVLKTPSVNFEDDPVYIEMFAREEWIGRLVASPHVLKALPPQRLRRHLYTVTEYFEGRTLRQWMQDNPRPELEAVRGIVDQVARGLRALHRKDIIHQDLKPENIMIDRHGLVKIIDFGSARAAGVEEAAAPLDRPQLVGTVDYTAPEYHLGERPTNRADIYALAAIAYEMLTGHLPYGRGFAGPRDVPRLRYISARQFRDDIPAWMDAALEHALRKEPAQRTEALSALVEDLRRPAAGVDYERPRPLLERSPLAVWKLTALVLLLSNLALLFLLLR